MRGRQFILFIVCTAGLFISCSGQSTSGPVATAPSPVSVKPETRAGWEAEWEKTLAGARKEGRVVVYGPPGSDTRQALTDGFKKAYPYIQVEYVGAPGSAHIAKVKAERRAGLYLVDLVVSGTTTINSGFKEFAIPVEPLLILPDVKEGNNWLDGKLHFADKEGKFNLVFTTHLIQPMIYNPTLLDPKRVPEISYWDFTRPEFKGKIVMRDPWTTGPGNIAAMFFYSNPQLGPDFIRALGKNEPLISRDDRQVLEWVSIGRFTVGLGSSNTAITELVVKGGMANVIPVTVLKEGAMTTASFGSLGILEGYPHRDAARLFVNWLLTSEGQLAWSKATGTASRRLDVPSDHVGKDILPKAGVKYINTYSEEFQDIREKMMPLIFEVFGRG